MIKLAGPNNELKNDINTPYLENLCLEQCRSQVGGMGSGCEIVHGQNGKGCYAHTLEVKRGSGRTKGFNNTCWIFSHQGEFFYDQNSFK